MDYASADPAIADQMKPLPTVELYRPLSVALANVLAVKMLSLPPPLPSNPIHARNAC